MSTPAAPQPSVPGLPDGLTVRPLALGDARAAYELLAAEERHDLSAVEIEEADVLSDWQRPSWNISTGTVGVFADADLAGGPSLVGYAEITGHDHGSVAVHPDHRGRGIGTALAHWTQAAAAAHGMGWIGMPVPRGSPGDRLLESLGYEVRWTSWLLELPAGTTLPERPLPAGHAVRQARADELEAVWEVNEDAFLEWSERDRTTFSEWRARIVDRPGYEPRHLRVCVEAGDAVVGVLLLQVGGEDAAREAHVDRLAVRADRRGHGLGQALLVDGFAAATARGPPVARWARTRAPGRGRSTRGPGCGWSPPGCTGVSGSDLRTARLTGAPQDLGVAWCSRLHGAPHTPLEAPVFDLVNGLPVHALVVHAVVVVLPLAALGTIAMAVRPAWRVRYGPVVVLAAAAGTALVPVAVTSGEALSERVGDPGRHEDLGRTVLWFALPVLVLSLALWLLERQRARGGTPGAGTASGPPPWVRHGIAVLAGLAAVALTVQVVRTGDAGSRVVWEGRVGSASVVGPR